MDNHGDKPIIIDFFGAPGSGKTTISHFLAEKLEHKGYKVNEDIFRINSMSTEFNRKIIKGYTAILYTLKNYTSIKDFFASLNKGTFRGWNDMVIQWINICFVLSVLSQEKGHDIIIAEQGLSQAIVSLAANGKNNLSKLFQKLESKIPATFVYVHIQVDLPENLIRLEHRNDGSSDVELEYDVVKKEALLRQINEVCEEIKNIKGCMTVDNSLDFDSPEHFQHMISEQLESLLKFELQKALNLKSILL